ncbi:hypothetical protein K469DRAFT_605880 [Zopfia rhizophila CBS 207.26]|uniref:Transcription factor domain-containing protein n=1 Tax=Zopfia rhizophila CBS 207.26 TaxID=1314779 RepID=A0A6A6DBB7_9PEZI|nr:hypothetical protein K469DRAFT_605880 [Zopfia rhizophila CBS 207.26]
MLPAVSLTSETAFLLQTYRRTVATWMDVFDHNQTYELSIPRLTLTSPLLFHCICAFTARHLSLSQSGRNSSWTPIAQHHYGEALRLLISLLNSPSAQDHALTATILLSSYEVISSLGQEHRRHFLGAMMLIKSHGITARSIGIDRANFWIYVRHEIGVALATEKPLILNPDEWNVQWEEGETREDMLGNHILWILARAIGLVYGRSKEAKDIELEQRKRKELIDETYKWRHELPDTFVWVKYGEPDEEGFKRVYFAVSAAAAAMFWYHIVHILLLAEPTVQDQTHDSEIQYHAMQIANIAISDIPDSVRVFSSHGLYYAAKRIDGVARKARIWNLLHDIETQLGYHTRTAVKRLQGLVETGN